MNIIAPEKYKQRGDGSQLDDDVEGKRPVVGGQTEVMTDDKQVRRGGDRNEFGQSLHDAEDEGVNKGQFVSP